MENLIHILFDPAGAEKLQQSFALDDIISGEIVIFEDDLSAGPLAESADPEQNELRKNWNQQLLGEGTQNPANSDALKLKKLISGMLEDSRLEAWIWAAQHPRDLCGYYCLGRALAPFAGRVHLLYLNNLPFLNEKGQVFYPRSLSQIPPREFLKARKLAREIPASEWDIDAAEWLRLVQGKSLLRTLEGGRILGELEVDAYDAALMSNCGAGFQKAIRISIHTQEKAIPFASIPFLVWRIRELASAGILESKGNTAGNEFDIRLKGAEQELVDFPDEKIGENSNPGTEATRL